MKAGFKPRRTSEGKVDYTRVDGLVVFGVTSDALFHAEANTLLRAPESYGGSLAGRTIEMRVDRWLCGSCDKILPSLGTQVGNPTVRIIDSTGAIWIMRDGTWIRRGRP